jgi:ATP-dependent Clp protease ATP-binding subunit ClpX
VGLDKIIERRNGSKTLGFHSAEQKQAQLITTNVSASVEPEDLLSFGMIPEFIGRLPVLAALEQLSEEELVKILTEPRNALVKQFTKLLAMDDISLTVTKDALNALAEAAVKKGTGARALRSLLEKIMLDVMYEAPDRDDLAGVTLNRAVVEGRRSALVRRRQDKDAA